LSSSATGRMADSQPILFEWGGHRGRWPRIHRPSIAAASLARGRRSGVGGRFSFVLRLAVLHERGDLHELDGRGHAVETGYPLDELIGEKRFRGVL